MEEAKKCANELFELKTAIPDIYNKGVWLDLPDDYDEEDYSEDEDDEFDENLFPIQTELYHTDLNGGVERAEHYKVGDEVKLIQEYNAEDGYMGIRVEHELGFVGYTSCADEIIEIQNETNNEEPLAKIIEVQPLSQRSKRCKKPLVVIEIYLKENK